MSEQRLLRALEEHIRQHLGYELADIDGDGRGRWRPGAELGIYDVDQSVTKGPVVLIRRNDGARFEVDLHVIVTPERDR